MRLASKATFGILSFYLIPWIIFLKPLFLLNQNLFVVSFIEMVTLLLTGCPLSGSGRIEIIKEIYETNNKIYIWNFEFFVITLVSYIFSFLDINPIRPDPFEFLISLSVCLRDTHSLTTIWNELEGWNFACRFDFTFYEDPSIQILKIDPFRVGGRGNYPI